MGDAVHEAMVETINVPANDRFQIFTAHQANELIADPTYLNVERSGEVIFVQITLNLGRTVDQKQALYKRIAELVSTQAAIRPEDIVINLIELPKENWSFGNGEAQYVQK
ncbi:MAG TPA: tautomerase family protein [Anaerolineae bacterium]|nr:tautomerase family protein [Anaerolineae bacterium]